MPAGALVLARALTGTPGRGPSLTELRPTDTPKSREMLIPRSSRCTLSFYVVPLATHSYHPAFGAALLNTASNPSSSSSQRSPTPYV